MKSTVKENNKYYLLVIALTFIVSLLCINPCVYASVTVPDKPTDGNIFVQDYSNVLSESTKNYIHTENEKLFKEKGIQIAMLTVDSLNGAEVESYANEVFNKWGIGSHEKNNGILILLATKDRKFRVHLGSGISKYTDGQEVVNLVKPLLKENKFEEGLKLAFDESEKMALKYSNQADAKNSNATGIVPSNESNKSNSFGLIFIPILVTIVGIVGIQVITMNKAKEQKRLKDIEVEKQRKIEQNKISEQLRKERESKILEKRNITKVIDPALNLTKDSDISLNFKKENINNYYSSCSKTSSDNAEKRRKIQEEEDMNRQRRAKEEENRRRRAEEEEDERRRNSYSYYNTSSYDSGSCCSYDGGSSDGGGSSCDF